MTTLDIKYFEQAEFLIKKGYTYLGEESSVADLAQRLADAELKVRRERELQEKLAEEENPTEQIHDIYQFDGVPFTVLDSKS